MLIKKTPSTNDVVVVKLITGEELVGRLVRVSAETIELAKPVKVEIQSMQGGQAGIAFAPFSLAADDAGEFTIYTSCLLTAPQTPRADISTAYLKATTGLDLSAAQGGLVL